MCVACVCVLLSAHVLRALVVAAHGRVVLYQGCDCPFSVGVAAAAFVAAFRVCWLWGHRATMARRCPPAPLALQTFASHQHPCCLVTRQRCSSASAAELQFGSSPWRVLVACLGCGRLGGATGAVVCHGVAASKSPTPRRCAAAVLAATPAQLTLALHNITATSHAAPPVASITHTHIHTNNTRTLFYPSPNTKRKAGSRNSVHTLCARCCCCCRLFTHFLFPQVIPPLPLPQYHHSPPHPPQQCALV